MQPPKGRSRRVKCPVKAVRGWPKVLKIVASVTKGGGGQCRVGCDKFGKYVTSGLIIATPDPNQIGTLHGGGKMARHEHLPHSAEWGGGSSGFSHQ